MELTKVGGKFRQLFRSAPQLWLPFVRGWIMNGIEQARPCAFPGATQLVMVPFDDYYESYQFFAETREGRLEIAAFTGSLKKGDVMFDIGGFRGAYAMASKACLADLNVHVFEPVRANAERIRKIIELNQIKNVQVNDTAVGEGETVRGFIDPHDGMLRNSNDAAVAPIEVPACSLDSFIRESGTTPTIIKLDVDGFEYEVLRGAELCLRRSRPRLWIELHPGYLADRGIAVESVTSLLAAAGYRIVDFSDATAPDRQIAYHVWAVHPGECELPDH